MSVTLQWIAGAEFHEKKEGQSKPSWLSLEAARSRWFEPGNQHDTHSSSRIASIASGDCKWGGRMKIQWLLCLLARQVEYELWCEASLISVVLLVSDYGHQLISRVNQVDREPPSRCALRCGLDGQVLSMNVVGGRTAWKKHRTAKCMDCSASNWATSVFVWWGS